MKKNVIILTHGWTGSSVFTALVGKAGYWHGNTTFQKTDYDTHENMELVELNKRMLSELGFEGDHEHDLVSLETVEGLARKADTLDMSPYKAFVEKCGKNAPWIWKDPRLTWTIRVWAKLLPVDQVSFVILTRDDEQAWISSNLRRHIQSREFTRKYNGEITMSLKKFLSDEGQDYLEFEFEDLQLKPAETISQLNDFLDVQLSMTDLKSVYNLPLFKKSKNFKDKVTALAIYLKNYNQRDNRL